MKTGLNVTFPKCRVTGFPAPIVTWKKLTGVFPRQKVVNSGGFLILTNAERKDTGPYECRASNLLGEHSAVTTLFVWSAPKFVIRPPNKVFNSIGGSLSVNCSATGETIPIISWKRIGGAWEEKRMKVHKGVLTISELTDKDSGIYLCEAKGPHFTIEARTHLEVKGQL